MQHSQKASQRNWEDVWAAHTNNGKASIWLTISLDDAKFFKVMWYALGAKESVPSPNTIPKGTKRFALLSKHPWQLLWISNTFSKSPSRTSSVGVCRSNDLTEEEDFSEHPKPGWRWWKNNRVSPSIPTWWSDSTDNRRSKTNLLWH